MPETFLLALDQGTTSTRAVVFTKQGRPVAQASFPFAQHYPSPGWVEHDPEDLLSTSVRALRAAVEASGVSPQNIAALGIANQRETALLWERDGGRAVCPAIVWQCRRTAPIIQRIKEEGYAPLITATTGLVPDAYFSASKITWLMDEAGFRSRAEAGELRFGTVDSFLASHLVEGAPHVTDATNASRTMLFSLRGQAWDKEMLRVFHVPEVLLPQVTDTSGYVGTLKSEILGAGIPVTALAGDQHAALFGQGCHAPGGAKNTYGTGCFMLMNIGDAPRAGEGGLLSTMAWRIGGKPVFALEGSVFTAGAAIQWLRDGLGVISCAAESETLAREVADSGGVHFVPAFTGLGAPYWDMYARGTFTGLTRGTDRRHLCRAALEAIAFQSDDLLTLMERVSGTPTLALRVDGGATENSLLMQMQADISGVRVIRPAVRESTALGAARLAGLAVGIPAGEDSAHDAPGEGCTVFEPRITADERGAMRSGWARAVGTALHWAQGDKGR